MPTDITNAIVITILCVQVVTIMMIILACSVIGRHNKRQRGFPITIPITLHHVLQICDAAGSPAPQEDRPTWISQDIRVNEQGGVFTLHLL